MECKHENINQAEILTTGGLQVRLCPDCKELIKYCDHEYEFSTFGIGTFDNQTGYYCRKCSEPDTIPATVRNAVKIRGLEASITMIREAINKLGTEK